MQKRNKKGQFVKGMPPWNKGKKTPLEVREKQRQAKLKNPTRYWLGKKRPAYTKGKPLSRKHKEKLSKAHKGQKPWNTGRSSDKQPNWQGGKSFEPYGTDFNERLKEEIRRRDNYVCQECGYTQSQLRYKLNVHHVDYDKTNNKQENLISLCRTCHSQTNFKREDWIKYFERRINGDFAVKTL